MGVAPNHRSGLTYAALLANKVVKLAPLIAGGKFAFVMEIACKHSAKKYRVRKIAILAKNVYFCTSECAKI